MPDGCRGPRPVVGSARAPTLAAGVSHTCGVTLTGQLSCRGLNHGWSARVRDGHSVLADSGTYYGGTSPVACALTPETVLGTPVFSAVGAGDADVRVGRGGNRL